MGKSSAVLGSKAVNLLAVLVGGSSHPFLLASRVEAAVLVDLLDLIERLINDLSEFIRLSLQEFAVGQVDLLAACLTKQEPMSMDGQRVTIPLPDCPFM